MKTLWLSETVLVWLGTVLVAGLSGFWLVWDALRLRRFWIQGNATHDEWFGSIMGVIIAILGLIGVARYWAG